ncbi:lectin-like domain-containing protein [Glycomyces harbinensis]|uniref:Uncharacterized protein n=1 Tax=Glycomyces harbinensis TaxID=58114 RepID=A0A1G6V121_9ACTN|nr:hypothetical protein [Glycomyces harbinensis]SDD47238.1 hypothetical protein SAMN05216270_104150 [Glycomyces harbinensis]
MKRIAMVGAGSMVLAAALAAVPATAGAQAVDEKKVVLVNAPFTGDGEGMPPEAISLDACLTAATELGGVDEFDSCADQNVGPVPESGKSPGFLQLTDAGEYDAGAAVYNKALPNKGGIEVTFAQFQYGGTGADGISFFLVDGETDLTEAGGFGGSLGYAPHTDNPGIDGGYLGLGLDAWGNYSADTEGRGEGCPEDYRAPAHLQIATNRAPDNVALRGPGQGFDGYCLLATTATDEKIGEYASGDIYGTDFPESLRSETLADAKRLVKLKVTDGEHPTVTVDIDFLDGEGWTRVLETAMPFAAPDTFKIGFASSTGGATDVHLIRHLRVETFVD